MSESITTAEFTLEIFVLLPGITYLIGLLQYAGDGSMTANILDTAATISASTGINIIKNDI